MTKMSIKVFVPFWIVSILISFHFAKNFPVLEQIALIGCGILIWTIIEYIFHRYLFHASSSYSSINKLVFLMHGNHHEDPNDPMRNLMPLIVTVPAALVLWMVFGFIAGPAGHVAYTGFLIGYFGYDLVHYLCHQGRMPLRMGALIKRHHMLHHYAVHDCNYGVTSTFWDRVFRTTFHSSAKRNNARRP